MLKAFIFDMDGVLIDSMIYHADAWKAAFSDVGINVTRKDICNIEGSNHEQVIRMMFERSGKTPIQADFEGLASKKREIFARISNLKPFEGIYECLRTLKSIYSLAVVSGSDRADVLGILDRFFPGLFDIVVTGEDVKEGKPSPEPYLKVIELLGISKDECIVVENAPMGVESAKRAGLYCVAVPTYVEPERLKKADLVLADHAALIEYLCG